MTVILSGSPRGKNSKTLRLALQLAEAAGEEVTLFDASAWRIDPCTGCESCFRNGSCIRQEQDDLKEIIDALWNANAVIIASPVYASGMTGQMKTLIDRLSCQLHLMILAGAPAVVITTASRSYHNETAEQLSQVLEFMGASVLEKIALTDRDEPDAILKSTAEKLRTALEPDKVLQLSPRTERWFAIQSRQFGIFKKIMDLLPGKMGEARQWIARGYDRFDSVHELTAKMKIRRSQRSAYERL